MTDLKLLALTSFHLVLTALPGTAAALFAARRGLRDVPILLALWLAVSGVVAMLTFWAFYAEPVLGEAWAYFVALGSAAAVVACLWGGRVSRPLLLRLATPLALWALGTLFLVFFGFIHGGSESAVVTAAPRFFSQFPSDNDIPNFYAEWFFANGHRGTIPLYPPDWHFSDRPPLQVGYVLGQRGFGWDPYGSLNYQLVSVGLQQLWIVGLWALLSAARVSRLTRGLTVLTGLVSGLALLNGFYVWPKLLPAAMVLAAAALIITPLWSDARRDRRAAVLIAVLLSLAMLGHGSSVFAVVPIAIVAAVRGLPSWRWIGVAALTGLVLLAPWSAFQKYEDPPGNRLTKWMLAGVTESNGEYAEVEGAVPPPAPNTEGSLEAIINAYKREGLDGTLHNKGQNFVSMVGGGPAVQVVGEAIDSVEEGRPGFAVQQIRGMLFFNLLPSLGLLALVPLFMLAGVGRRDRNPAEWRFALLCYFVFAVGAVIWGLLLFGNLPSRTIVHAGTYVLPILGFCGGVVGLRAVYPRFAVWYVAVAAVLMFALYVPSFTPPPGTSYSPIAAVLCAACLAGCGYLALRREEPDTTPTEPVGRAPSAAASA